MSAVVADVLLCTHTQHHHKDRVLSITSLVLYCQNRALECCVDETEKVCNLGIFLYSAKANNLQSILWFHCRKTSQPGKQVPQSFPLHWVACS